MNWGRNFKSRKEKRDSQINYQVFQLQNLQVICKLEPMFRCQDITVTVSKLLGWFQFDISNEGLGHNINHFPL